MAPYCLLDAVFTVILTLMLAIVIAFEWRACSARSWIYKRAPWFR